VRERQCHREGGPDAELAPRDDAAAMALGDLSAQRQPDTGAGILAAAVQPLEDAKYPLVVLRFEADPASMSRLDLACVFDKTIANTVNSASTTTPAATSAMAAGRLLIIRSRNVRLGSNRAPRRTSPA
jgi:hypothetical protein